MIKRNVVMPIELIKEIALIVQNENYVILKKAFPSIDAEEPVFLSLEEAEGPSARTGVTKRKRH